MSILAIVVLSVLLTIVVVMLALNFVPTERKLQNEVTHCDPVGSDAFRREMSALLGPAIDDGNRVDYLENGDRIFPAMLEAIRAAQKTITFETYIYWSGEIGTQFADALIERCQAGVRVHLLLDWLGSEKMDRTLLKRMADTGIEVQRFHPPKWYTLSHMNNRTHRKLLVVDGRIGFTGGVGIADQWMGDAQDAAHWRDAHFRIEGPAVAQVQATFMSNWIKASDRVLQGDDYFPELQSAGNHPAQMFSSSPSGGSESMQLMYLVMIAASTKSIDLSAAYFVPGEITREVLLDAMKRGVRMRMITPGRHIDSTLVRAASRTHWGELLEAGAQIFEYQPTMFHNKIMIVDGLVTSVGSTNFDNRSFSINAEASLNVYDAGFARSMTEVFERDLQKCKPVTLEDWRRRGFGERARDRLVDLFAAQL